ncbi:MAG: hypothetical protein O2931_01525 [Planctomycetota bacterium]|nr:hypothetical protein [Planctomycetota bacterium]
MKMEQSSKSTKTRTRRISPTSWYRVASWSFVVALGICCSLGSVNAQQSAARRWNEAILSAIRIDTPRPPVHARNLYHVSAAMYDAWASFDATAKGSFVGEKNVAGDVEAARNEAVSYAAYRVLSDRYTLSASAAASQTIFDNLLASQGYNKNVTTTVGSSPAAVGNRIAQQILNQTLNDGSNESNNYADNSGYALVNTPMISGFPTATNQANTPLTDPNRWQPLYINNLTSKNGQVQPSDLQAYIAPHWGPVTTFALKSTGPHSWSSVDPGPPPQLNGVGDAAYRAGVMDMIRKSASLNPQQGAGAQLINISPRVYGNRPLGTHTNLGHAVNPITGAPFVDQFVKQADHARVLAEYWADGPHSETPPGHWNVIANQVADSPLVAKKIGGTGPVITNLEWDVKTYLALNGATHDAAIAAWGAKRAYDSARPITMVRYMGSQGQSSNALLPSFSPDGLPLETELIELITAESIAPGGRHRNVYDQANVDSFGDFFAFAEFTEANLVGKVAIKTWNGVPENPTNEVGTTDWILATSWLPYQMETFVTPAFPGYVSGHSTFSRSAAEVLAGITGSPYFPGGLMEAQFNTDFLKFEDGPSGTVKLQWTSYFDAADEAGISRLWGGIHPSFDDFPARIMGSEIGKNAFLVAKNLFIGAGDTDLNGDGSIDGADVAMLFNNWAGSGVGDCTGDGIVDGADLALVFGDWTGDSNHLASVPEPSTMALTLPLVTLLAGTLRRRSGTSGLTSC